MSDHCEHCPISGAPCPAKTLPHPPYCDRVNPAHSSYHPGFAAILRRKAHPDWKPDQAGASVPLELAEVPRASAVLPATAAACPHRRTSGGGCGCAAAICASTGRRPGDSVSIGDCQECRAATAVPVAIVIPCHDYGRFLGECLDSVLAQDSLPEEILIVDDRSSDDTAEVAARYREYGVRYLRVEHGDVFRTRESGYLATSAELVCFLDADDILPPDYLSRGVPLFSDRRVGWVYSDVEHFGDRTGRVHYPSWDEVSAGIEAQNYCHAGSIVRRAALELVDAFSGPSPPALSHADWYLWRTLLDGGWRGAWQPAVYRYRKHPASMLDAAVRQPYFDQSSLELAEVTIFTPLAGRVEAWHRYRDWLEGQTWPRAQCRLVLMDTSGDPTFGAMVRGDLAALDYPDVRYQAVAVGSPGLADLPRAEHVAAVRLACARIYGRMARDLGTAFVLVVEDDVIPAPGAIGGLLRGMDARTAVVAAPYRSRFHPGYVAWDAQRVPLERGTGLETAGGSGFGCTLIRRSVLIGENFASLRGESGDYDLAFAARLGRAGWTYKVDWSLEAEHLGALEVPGPSPTVDPPQASTSGSSSVRERLELVWACDHRSPLDECSCTGRHHCGLARGRFASEPNAVTTGDCLECVSS